MRAPFASAVSSPCSGPVADVILARNGDVNPRPVGELAGR
jgi:hypothetical protein